MSREVRRVPLDWEHPHEWRDQWSQRDRMVVGKNVFRPMFGPDRDYASDLAWFLRSPDDFDGQKPDPNRYMPDFSDVPEDQMGIAMYESVTEGTPISPAFRTAEELARWLADHNAPAFGGQTATYEQWLGMIGTGWAPSAASDSRGFRSGVAFVADRWAPEEMAERERILAPLIEGHDDE